MTRPAAGCRCGRRGAQKMVLAARVPPAAAAANCLLPTRWHALSSPSLPPYLSLCQAPPPHLPTQLRDLPKMLLSKAEEDWQGQLRALRHAEYLIRAAPDELPQYAGACGVRAARDGPRALHCVRQSADC